MENDPTPFLSPLSQQVNRDGQAVRVDIYENGEGGWILEVVDQFNNSTVWDQAFPSDAEALKEAMRTIEEEGIESLIDAPPSCS
jgi:hypothetical protein